MAQKIKLRRGPVGNLTSVVTEQGELLLATGSISDLSGPFLTMTGTGGTGASTLVGKIYEGTTAPSIGSNGALLGTPFYETSNEALVRLNTTGNGGNETLDLTGNIENNSISSVTIDTLDGDVNVNGDITGSNLRLTGNANIDGDITLGGNITIGDGALDIVDFNGVISSSLVPSSSGDFDLGSPTSLWANLYVQNFETATGSFSGDISVSGSAQISGGVQLLTTLNVDGQATLASLNVEDLVDNQVVIAGTSGELEGDGNFTFDGTTLTVGQLTIDQSTGNTSTAGTLTVGGNTTLEGDVFVSGSLTLLESATSLIISSSVVELDDNIIRLNAFAPFQRYAGFEVIDSGSVGVSASLQWDSQNDYWLIQSSSQQTGKVVSTTFGTFGTESSLTENTIPKGTGPSSIGDSNLTDDNTYLIYDTDAFIVTGSSGNTITKGDVTILGSGGADAQSNSSAVVFINSSNTLGYVSTSETTDQLDGILGYNNSNGELVFSTTIDGGTF